MQQQPSFFGNNEPVDVVKLNLLHENQLLRERNNQLTQLNNKLMIEISQLKLEIDMMELKKGWNFEDRWAQRWKLNQLVFKIVKFYLYCIIPSHLLHGMTKGTENTETFVIIRGQKKEWLRLINVCLQCVECKNTLQVVKIFKWTFPHIGNEVQDDKFALVCDLRGGNLKCLGRKLILVQVYFGFLWVFKLKSKKK